MNEGSVGLAGSGVGSDGTPVGLAGAAVAFDAGPGGLTGSFVGLDGTFVGFSGMFVGLAGSAAGPCGRFVGPGGPVAGLDGAAGGCAGGKIGADTPVYTFTRSTMPTDFIPRTDAGLLAWSANFSALITAGPTSYGLTAGNASTLAAMQTAYANALEAATNPATRGGSTVLAKDTARATLVQYCRQLARCVQGTLTVTNQQRYDLGLTVRDVEPTPIPPPATAPVLEVVSVSGNRVRIRMRDAANPTRRGKPLGVAGAAVFSCVGAAAPTDAAGWHFEGNTGLTTVDVLFPSETAPGAKVWFTAFWFNPRSQSGPACAPVGTNIPGGAAMAA